MKKMKMTAWCYNCRQEICFDNNTRNRNGVAIPVDEYGNLHICDINQKLAFRIKNVLDVDGNTL
jgi:hypothetical protein